MPLVFRIAHNSCKDGDNLEDLIEAAMYGLSYAIANYDPKRNDNFAKYAGMVIQNEGINNYKRSFAKTVKHSTDMMPQYNLNYDYIESKGNIRERKVTDLSFYKQLVAMNSDLDTPIDAQFYQKILDIIYKDIESNFELRDIEIFYCFTGLNDYDKMKGKDIAKKYDISESNVTYICKKIMNYIITQFKAKLKEV